MECGCLNDSAKVVTQEGDGRWLSGLYYRGCGFVGGRQKVVV